MALRETAEATRPAFEGEVVREAASTGTAIAAPASTAVVTKGYGGNIFDRFKDALESIEFGTLPRIVGAQGSCQAKFGGKVTKLGDSIDLELISFNDEYVISPGAEGEDATKMVRYSYDGGKTIEGTGEDVNAYIAKLRDTLGYPNASVKKYVQLVGIVERVQSKDPAAQKLVSEMVQVSLAPQAVKAFNNHQLQLSVKVHQKRASADGIEKLTVTADARHSKGKDFTALVVGPREAA